MALSVGSKFSSYEDLKLTIKHFESENFVNFYKKECKKIATLKKHIKHHFHFIWCWYHYLTFITTDFQENLLKEESESISMTRPTTSTSRRQNRQFNASWIKEALEEIRSQKLSINAAAKKYGLPRSTIHNHLHGW